MLSICQMMTFSSLLLHLFLVLVHFLLTCWILINFIKHGYKCKIHLSLSPNSSHSHSSPRGLLDSNIDGRLVLISIIAVISFLLTSIIMTLLTTSLYTSHCDLYIWIESNSNFNMTNWTLSFSHFIRYLATFGFMFGIGQMYCIFSFKLVRMYQKSIYQVTQKHKFILIFWFAIQMTMFLIGLS